MISGGDLPKSVIALLVVNAVLFLLSQMGGVEPFVRTHLCLRTDSFMPWQLFSYAFFHGSLMHLFFNMLSLFFLAPPLMSQFQGEQHFVKFFMVCAVGAGLLSYPVGYLVGMGPILGASGAIYGLFYAFYRFFPEAIVHVFFVLPIKIKYLMLLAVVISFVAMFDTSSGVAHVTHLGGVVVAWAWFRYADSFRVLSSSWQRKREDRQFEQDREMKQEVDQILEKISKVGMGGLSSKEKNLLKRASKRLKDK
jgi:membrane associated rhomboid family serine protease